MLELIIFMLCGSIVVSGLLAIHLSSTTAALLSSGTAGLFAALCYLLLGAPDVAMTEASIGSGLSTLIFLYALHRTESAED